MVRLRLARLTHRCTWDWRSLHKRRSGANTDGSCFPQIQTRWRPSFRKRRQLWLKIQLVLPRLRASPRNRDNGNVDVRKSKLVKIDEAINFYKLAFSEDISACAVFRINKHSEDGASWNILVHFPDQFLKYIHTYNEHKVTPLLCCRSLCHTALTC